jgi:hypothetical protein
MKPSQIATLLFQETQSVTGIINRVEERGWSSAALIRWIIVPLVWRSPTRGARW